MTGPQVRRIAAALATTSTGLVLLFAYPTSLDRTMTVAEPSASAPAPATAGSGPAAPGTAPAGTAPAADATYDGTTISMRYGPVQVRITVASGRITAADAIQLPSGNSYDDQVKQHAVPVLVKEALAAQSAKIAMVSGATYTSSAYVQSLQSALDQAHL
ncbi:MAG: FMN-binding protein [Cellulomonas sp.]